MSVVGVPLIYQLTGSFGSDVVYKCYGRVKIVAHIVRKQGACCRREFLVNPQGIRNTHGSGIVELRKPVKHFFVKCIERDNILILKSENIKHFIKSLT